MMLKSISGASVQKLAKSMNSLCQEVLLKLEGWNASLKYSG